MVSGKMTLLSGDVGVVEVKVQSKLHSIELRSGFRITIMNVLSQG